MCLPLSMWAWAALACESGKVESISGLTRPEARSGSTFLSTAWAMAALSATARARSVEPVWVRRLSISRMRSTVTRDEARNAICTMRPSDGGGFVVAADIIAADHIEDQVDAGPLRRLLAQSDKILGVIIDGEIGAELAAGVTFPRRAGGYQDMSAERLAELNSLSADPRRAAVHEQCFADGEPAALEHIVPDREERLRNRRGLDH